MHTLAVLALALPALAAPFQPTNTLVAAREELPRFECNPPFPKAPQLHVAEAVQNMDLYFPIDADNNPITTSIGKSSKRQNIDDKLDFLGKKKFSENAYEESGRRATQSPGTYEVKGKQCMFISAVGQAGIWICNDSEKPNPVSFMKASQIAGQAFHRCEPDEETSSSAMAKCLGKPTTKERMACYDEEVFMSAQVFVPGDWNMIIRKNDGIAPAMPAVPGKI